jgi:ATP-dependent helicase HrpB
MSQLVGEKVGGTVGYRMRMDTRVSGRTRIEVVTEGVLTRFLQSDPTLDEIGLVIFDEFHERSLNTDVGLALTLHSQRLVRPDLRILVMSATLGDTRPISELLRDATTIISEGRSYPVETRYLTRQVEGRIERAVVASVNGSLARDAGDILVFLPGAGEIRRVAEDLRFEVPEHVNVLPLFGNLSQGDQDQAIRPAPPGRRKVVLATSIAETSLTIEGVGVVIDSGLMRVPRFSPRTGMTRLETIRVSRSSADQRRGRAGRLGPGVCYRLWTESEDASLPQATSPEILSADLAPLALDLAVAGISDSSSLSWLNPPQTGAFTQARALLASLGALTADGTLTPHGWRMSELALHPRLAHMVLAAHEDGYGALACDLAALLSERDVMRGGGESIDVDLRTRVELLRRIESAGWSLDREALRRARTMSEEWRKEMRATPVTGDVDACGLVLAYAYPDRIAQKRIGSVDRYLLRNGTGAALPEGQPLASAEFLVVAELDGRVPESRIFLAAPVELGDIERELGAQIERSVAAEWDERSQSVVMKEAERLGAIILKEIRASVVDPDAALEILSARVAADINLLPWTSEARRLQQRLAFLRLVDKKWPDVSDSTLQSTVREWFPAWAYGMRGRSDLQRLNMVEVLLSRLTPVQRRTLDELAPTHLIVPSGSKIPIDYEDPAAAVLAVRLQEMFGLSETPRIGGDRVPLTIHLLSPAHRPVQITRDLASFWRTTYFEVKKDLQGRYPKHHWPDDPIAAHPTARSKRRN